MDVHIRGHRTVTQPRWRDHIYERLSKLDRFQDNIIKLDVILTSSHHHLKGNELCRIRVKVPKRTIAVWGARLTWLIAIFALGNIAMSFYMLKLLWGLPDDATGSDILLKRAT